MRSDAQRGFDRCWRLFVHGCHGIEYRLLYARLLSVEASAIARVGETQLPWRASKRYLTKCQPAVISIAKRARDDKYGE